MTIDLCVWEYNASVTDDMASEHGFGWYEILLAEFDVEQTLHKMSLSDGCKEDNLDYCVCCILLDEEYTILIYVYQGSD